jgi:hypothetical protein
LTKLVLARRTTTQLPAVATTGGGGVVSTSSSNSSSSSSTLSPLAVLESLQEGDPRAYQLYLAVPGGKGGGRG